MRSGHMSGKGVLQAAFDLPPARLSTADRHDVNRTKCSVPECRDAILTRESEDALWQSFFTAAPAPSRPDVLLWAVFGDGAKALTSSNLRFLECICFDNATCRLPVCAGAPNVTLASGAAGACPRR